MKKIIRILFYSGLLAVGAVGVSSCSLDPTLTNNIDNEVTPISDVASMKAALDGMFSRMVVAPYYGRDIIIFSEARTHYMYSNNRTGRFGSISQGTVLESHAYPADTWAAIYQVISEANRLIAVDIEGETNATIEQYRAQAYIVRALAHYDLLREFGQQYVNGQGLSGMGIPYITVFADREQEVVRGTVKENMDAIMQDLETGLAILKDNSGNDRVYITYMAAEALKSRIALFFAPYDGSKYAEVSKAAKASIDAALTHISNIDVVPRNGFLDSYLGDGIASNSIMEFAQSGSDNLMTNSLRNIYYLSPQNAGYGDMRWNILTPFEDYFVVKDGETEIDDVRRNIIGEQGDRSLANIGKFTTSQSNIKMIRIEEVMFNYIEAFVEGGQGSGSIALEYFNKIVGNRILVSEPVDPTDPANDEIKMVPLEFSYAEMATEYKIQRTKELMFEGFGFEDIARWKQSFRNPLSNGNQALNNGVIEWNSTLSVMPIPLSERNVSKIPQNDGY